ncbi:glycosyltransferase family protein [Mangrovicoccus ximenensis]|uniref:glycosyltransferase family protein n=1 Tax=Mangrovicoccus ximenensis TaxID=1911570 RepID=UPI000D3D0ECD|nr:glycosyltransferase [Mangrovicoccus ximenensis]
MTHAGEPNPPVQSFADAKILIYSHDTFGLGHLRRCREIAHALVAAYGGISVLIISGATIAGAFEYRSRVDFVKIPSVIKLRNGEYTSLAEHIPLADTLAMRETIIRNTAESFAPDIFIVDKEPLGLRGEIEGTLAMLKARGTRLVLGLREVMDSPRLLAAEWAGTGKLEKMQRYYDTLWVYGPKGFNEPLKKMDAPPELLSRMRYTGFLRRSARPAGQAGSSADGRGGYILVTTGGGGDGEELTRQVLAAYQTAAPPQHRAIITLGPYLPARAREEIKAIAEGIPAVELLDFDNRLEDLIAGAAAVVGMAGYNTFCEILSFDKPALLVPRTQPREEQLIRAQRASALGLARMLLPEQANDAEVLAEMLRDLPGQAPPSASGTMTAGLGGLDTIVSDVGGWLNERHSRARSGTDG